MMMSDLPQDVVEEILSRVPATSLKRLRSTCKLWDTLLTDKGFTDKHFRKAPKQSLVLTLKKDIVFSTSVNLNIGATSVEFKGELVLKDSHSNPQQVDISNISHCDGLLLCTTKAHRLVVWNPCLGETRWIQLITGDEYWYYKFALGYVNNKSCRSYKILMWYDAHKVCRLKIYEFGSDSWRVLDHGSPDYSVQSSNVSLKGNAYWIAYENKDNSRKEFVLCFDFTRERFRRLCLPTFQNRGWMVLSSVKEEQLSVLHRSFGASKIEIWVTNKIDTEAALWRKSFTVAGIHSDSFPLPLSFLFDEEKKVAVCCNIYSPQKYTIEIYYTEVPFVETTHQVSWCPFIFNYVPSLVQIHVNERQKKRKKLVHR